MAVSPTEAPPAESEEAKASSTSEADPLIGQEIDGRYRVLRPLARGGMGAVYIAEHVPLHREVAFKVVRHEFAGHAEIATRFAREAIATAQFEHPHVVSAIDYGSLPGGGAYFVMQLARGRSLRQLLKEGGAMPWRRVCAIGAQVADALSAARARGIIHRDLKPDNLLVEVREDGSDLVKILDFGIARMEGTAGEGPEEAMPGQALTRVGMVMGTPGYMAPEQAIGADLDHRADLYSLGVVLWESITGKELWSGDDVTAIITKQMRDAPPPMNSVIERGAWPEDLEDLISQLLSRKAADRPEHPGDVRDALRALSLVPAADWGTSRTLFLQSESGSHRQFAPQLFDHVKPTLAQGQRWLRKSPLRAAIVAAVCVTLFFFFGAGDESQDAKARGVSASANAAKAKKGQGDESDSALDQVMEAAGSVVKPAVRAIANAGEPPLPADLEEPAKEMLEGSRLALRRKAARTLLAHEPESDLPKYLVAIANLEATSSCTKRRKALKDIAELGDERAKESVGRYYHSEPNGCGFLGMSDCYRCIRSDLRDTMKALDGDT